jgi:3-dehydroquinate synthase
MNRIKTINIKLKTNINAKVIIGTDILDSLGARLKKQLTSKNIVLITNYTVEKLYSQKIIENLRFHNFNVNIIVLKDSEESKNIYEVKEIIDRLLAFKIERKDTIIALGGGVIGDLAGFVAAIYLRGINLIHIPTTLLAQVDSSIGGKTGVNHAKGKNLIGAFYQPILTYLDTNVLQTLEKKQVLCGLAEIVKYGVIASEEYLAYLEQNINVINRYDFAHDQEVWRYLIEKAAKFKADIIMKDERESNLREILNFGHTIGHGIEAAFNYQTYLHGQAVAIGMLMAADIALSMELFSYADFSRLKNLLTALNFDLMIKKINIHKILDHIYLDKKIREKKLRFVLPTKIGSVETKTGIKDDLILDKLQKYLSTNVY